MEEAYREVLLQAASLFPPPPGIRFAYGTAGFRYNGLLLSSTIFRVGVLAALRSLKTGSVTGLMITASHNPASDNGVKVADPGGGILTQEWEPFADAIANAVNAENFVQLIDEFIKKQGILCGNAYSGVVLVARDTRPSGEELLSAAVQGIGAVKGVMAVDMGILTTPQLHWMVRSRNKGMPATESDYYVQLSSSVKILMETSPKVQKSGPHIEGVVVDGANGVGAKKLYTLQQFLEGIEVNIRNSGREGEGGLNDSVGADFVQKEKITPSGFGGDDVGKRCASLDGDADRLVYFYISSPEKKAVELIDGDKILTLFAIFIKQQLDSIYNQEKMESSPAVRLAQNPSNEECHSVTLGIVQTAYANGASTRYLRELGLEVVFTSTGVKYLHEKATEYGIGIYFEANGHGTILFSEKLLLWLNAFNEELSSASTVSEQRRAVQRLLAISSLINQAVGDALSGLLLVEVILHYMGWSIQTWNTLYQEVDLYLNVNALSGSIPPELASMSSLQVLQLCCNRLSGSIPSKLGSLKKLSFLALQHNQLTGAIPSSLGNIVSLNRLDLSFNNLTGAIPSSLGNIVNLNRLDLSFNNLTGAIPKTLASLQQLTDLNLKSNRLSGRVPQGLKDLLQGFQYDNNSKLCGDRFPKLPECNSSVPSSPPKPLGTSTLNITSNPVVSVPKIPVSANVPASCKRCSLSSSNRSKIKTVSVIIAVLFTATISIASLLFVWYRKEKQKVGSAFEASDARLSPDLFCNYSEDQSRKCPSPLILLEYSSDWDPLVDRGTGSGFRFNLEEIESTTNYFSDKSLLGRNGFASVYKGFLRDGSSAAVKCFSKTSCKTKEIEFQEGLNILMQIQHENLVKFRGFCISNARAECFLVYELVPNGTLLHHLEGEAGRNLEWSTRVRIAYGVAKGIEYLHHRLAEPIVHQNISAANILLDQDFSPHLSDCALQRLFADDIVFSILKTSAAMGYLAPEYATVGRLTLQSDIYAFGKILLQLLTGVIKDMSRDNSSTSSVHCSLKTLVECGKVEEFMDPRLDGKYSVAEATNLAEIALACTREIASERPPMDAVVQRFETGINQETET